MPLSTLSQDRARHAYQMVAAAFEKHRTDFKEEVAEPAVRIPMRIRNAGLGQAIAYLHAKQEAPDVVEALTSWLFTRGLIPDQQRDQLLIQFQNGSAATLRWLTAEALAYLEWYVRFAQAKTQENKSVRTG